MKSQKMYFLWIGFFLMLSNILYAQPEFVKGNDPKPLGTSWQLRPEVSDDFDGTELDLVKWKNTDPKRWIGRAPGLFKENTVSVKEGAMCITNYQLEKEEVVNGQTFTHGCGHVISNKNVNVGNYIECRMKANKTFLSSTFWLINYKNEGQGCDKRVTELDIQECVGQVTNPQSWNENFDQSMHSNTHSRNVSCDTPTGSVGNSVDLPSGKVYDDFHVYGAWWKSKNEILFYLDGVYQYSVTPAADFSIDLYIKLVTETYDWNPTPADGGMTGSWEDRTTKYDWVRTWELSTENVEESVGFNEVPNNVPPAKSYDFKVDYVANEKREIVVEVWSANKVLHTAKKTIEKGFGTTSIALEMDETLPSGNNYSWKVSLRAVGGQDNLSDEQIDNIIITSEPVLSIDDLDSVKVAIYPNPTENTLTVDVPKGKYSVDIYNVKGQKVIHKTLKNKGKVDVSALKSGSYILKVQSTQMSHTFNFIKK
ncbi:T9SS type A sorting domain-containing protein [Flammeovirga sp. EKP202]|uniref:T9SS type A sorting domain-containing protein n=1 Tax=Flammeovirga sp. EKP202 TaxID=2770592 RepID=UPI00165F7D68|nr:T9SS type A sorting domain-containing protein [Flammeovirga sp. EKP202]MBD0403737.1 T9SS type A sorting domain-containing protein [Flammeovirga sp. EKP202]